MKIGFKNFKKFQNFPMIELAPITFLVGPNNSGKSSFIKALTLLITNLGKYGVFESKSAPYQRSVSFGHPFITKFSFSEEGLTHYRWGDFLSCRNAATQDNALTLSLSSGDVNIDIDLNAPDEDIAINPNLNLKPTVEAVRISDKDTTAQYQRAGKDYKFSMEGSKDNLLHWIEELIDSKRNFITTLEETSAEIIYSGRVERRKDDVVEELKQEISFCENTITQIASYPNELLKFHEIMNGPNDNSNDLIIKYFQNKLRQLLGADQEKNIIDIIPDLYYIEAHNASHRISLDADDKNNYLAQTVKEFDSEISIVDDAELYKFVCEWLLEFKIAKAFEITKDYEGEIYKVDIIQDVEMSVYDKSYRQPLGHMGTGSIQIFILLLKIALAIKKSRFSKRAQLVLVEEPEQNLHPALQSELADLFLQANKLTEGKVQFVVETHSEYLIRRTQVMVAEECCADGDKTLSANPFIVYYFPKDGFPYDMSYLPSGRFANSFGEGFFDKASSLALKLSRIERSKSNGMH